MSLKHRPSFDELFVEFETYNEKPKTLEGYPLDISVWNQQKKIRKNYKESNYMNVYIKDKMIKWTKPKFTNVKMHMD